MQLVNDARPEVTVVAVAIVKRSHQILVGRRPTHATLAGLWEFPGGKVERGETPAEAAVRECEEETGLSVNVVGQLATEHYHYEHGQVELYFFDCELSNACGNVTPHRPFVWIMREKLKQLEFPPANDAIVARLCTRG